MCTTGMKYHQIRQAIKSIELKPNKNQIKPNEINLLWMQSITKRKRKRTQNKV
jgi:hypothetical protein